uniref:Gamma-tubulin complex component n=1 Tax=Strongyloides venezuelensis TaxID=75913 RepID=A0A0K0G3Y7_STRVS
MMQSMEKMKINLREMILKDYPPIKFIYECNLYSLGGDSGNKKAKPVDLSSKTFHQQEELLFNDLLMVLLGFNTDLISCKVDENGRFKWDLNESADNCTMASVKKCIMIAEILREVKVSLNTIKNRPICGIITQTICTIMEKYITDDFNNILYGLQRQPEKYISKILLALKDEEDVLVDFLETLREIMVSNIFGGQVISYLHERSTKCGNPSVKIGQLQQKILYACLDYYNKILYEWIIFGTLQSDPCLEFMVWNIKRHENSKWEKVSENESFSKIYIEVPALCPSIYASVQKYIFNCGKYLHVLEPNVMKRCTNTIYDPTILEFKNQYEMRNIIVEACQNHSKAVLLKLRQEHHLFDLFDAFNDIYLGRSASWITDLVFLFEDDLCQSTDKAETRRLNILFMEALRNTNLARNNLKKMFKVECRKTLLETLSEYNSILIQQDTLAPCGTYNTSKLTSETIFINLEGSEALSLVLSQQVIVQYNVIFKLFFALHRCVHLISQKRFHSVRPLNRYQQLVLYKMLHFVTKYFSFCFHKIIPQGYNAFKKVLENAEYIEDVVSAQNTFLADCFEKCLFNQHSHMSCITAALEIISNVCKDKLSFSIGSAEFDQLYSQFCGNLRSPTIVNHEIFAWFNGPIAFKK